VYLSSLLDPSSHGMGAEDGRSLGAKGFKPPPGLGHVIKIGWLPKMCDDHLKHLPCKERVSRSLRDLTNMKGTGRSHRRRIDRYTRGKSHARRLIACRRYRICRGVDRSYGAAQSLSIHTHRIKILTLVAMDIGIPHLHEATVVGQREP